MHEIQLRVWESLKINNDFYCVGIVAFKWHLIILKKKVSLCLKMEKKVLKNSWNKIYWSILYVYTKKKLGSMLHTTYTSYKTLNAFYFNNFPLFFHSEMEKVNVHPNKWNNK